jgi:endonuclease YncB( thermonuclease family)
MKKLGLIFHLLLMLIILTSCATKNENVVISKLFDATMQANNVIELYNNSEEDLDLKDYALNFYTNGATEVSATINLEGIIPANGYYAIGSSNQSDEDVKILLDLVYEDGSLPFNGNDVIELVHKDNRVDIIGFEGTDIDYALNLTLIRLGEVTDYKGSTTFDTFTFISYIPDVFKYLKNDTHEIKTLEDLYAGPQLEERYKNMPYIDPNNEENGAGGAVLVTNTSVADGDTAYFSAMNGFPGGSVRYFYLNTAEVDGGFVSAEPWGYVASKYNKEYLLNDSENKEIRIQSIPGSALNEGYGRNLGLVWINDYLSQFLIVAEGLTEDVPTIYEAYDLLLTYKDVPYLTFMRFAEQRAKENGWGLKGYPTNPDGEKSPDWNYQSNSKATTDPTWEPHLELPWV